MTLECSRVSGHGYTGHVSKKELRFTLQINLRAGREPRLPTSGPGATPVHRLQPLGRGVESEALGYSRGNTCMYFLGMNPIITFLGLHEPL